MKGTKITSSEAKHGEFTMEQLKHVHDNAKNIYNIPMMINDRGGVTVAYIDNMIRRECVKHDVRFVVIDYMQLISGVKNESTYERATRVANELKNIAKKYNVVIMALSQLNRLNEQRKDRRPNMSELRDSGSLEQNADVIMLLYRDGYYTQNSSDTDLEVNIAKHRHGKAGTVKLYYNPKWGSITDLEKEYE